MKTAILLRGLSRHYEKSIPLYRQLYPNADFYFHTWDIDGRRKDNTKRHSYSLDTVDCTKLVEYINPVKYKISNYNDTLPELESVIEKFLEQNNIKKEELVNEAYPYILNSIFCQIYSYSQVLNLVKGSNYSNILVSRFDFFPQFKVETINLNSVICSTPTHGESGTDSVHMFNTCNLNKMRTIYNELLDFKQKELLMIKKPGHPIFLKVENWYYWFFDKLNLKLIPQGKGNIIR